MMHEWGFGYGVMMGPLGMAVVALLLVIPFWKICEKAGYPGILALLIFVPILNLVFLYWFAFAEWPSQQSDVRDGQRPSGVKQ